MNTETSKRRQMVTSVVMFAGIAVVLLAMRAASEVLSPIFLALLLAVTTTPFLNWFIKKGLPTWLSLLLIIAIDVIIFLLIIWLVSVSVQNFTESADQYLQRLEEMQAAVTGGLSNLGFTGASLSDSSFSAEDLVGVVGGFAGGLASGLSNWGMIAFTIVYFLVEATIMPRKVENILHGSEDPDILQVVKLTNDLRQYMIINAGVGLLAAVLNTLFLYFMGVEFALLWGILSFFLSFVPNIGFIISVIPPAIMALLQFGWVETLIVVVVFIFINFVVDTIIKPRFIEEGVNISVTVTWLSLILWGWVLGPIGAILAVPMSMVIQAILVSNEDTRWMAYLMGSGKDPFDPEATEV
jgi:predicted PurR-regulated permease PerM